MKGGIKRCDLKARGIMINGASGTGKTTLGKELAKVLEFPHLDLDDYYWPRDAMGNLCYEEIRPRELIIEHLKNDLSKHSNFVMSGTIGNILWDFINPLFGLGILLFVPAEIRIERVKLRSFERYGDRVLVGGDLYEEYQKIYSEIPNYEIGYHSVSLERHEKWAAKIDCPVLRVDGTKPISENAAWIAGQYLSMQQNSVPKV